MKRILAVITLLAALGVLLRLWIKPAFPVRPGGSAPSGYHSAASAAPTLETDSALGIQERYQTRSPSTRELVARVAARFGRNAEAIERTDGLRGLILLDNLGLEAIFLYEKRPTEFRRLRDLMGEQAAADLLLHWREYFGLKRADDTDRAILIAEIARLTPPQQRIAARYPSLLPLMLTDPDGVVELIDRVGQNAQDIGDVLAVLSLVSLEQGASDLRLALRTFEEHPELALEACRRHGPGGLALVRLYGPVLEALGDAVPLEQGLVLLEVNADYIDELLRTHRPTTVAGHLRHVAGAGLIEACGNTPHGLRLVVEHGLSGEHALRHAGPDAAEAVFCNFTDPTLRNQAVGALAVHGPMALAILEKYASDPDFREILRTHGAAVIPPIAQVEAVGETAKLLQAKTKRSFTESLALAALFASGENAQAAFRTIRKDGLARMAQLNSSEVRFYQFLPLYDVTHLGNVLFRGHAPTTGELTWALVDGCFVIADVLSLAAFQPEGALAAESVRLEAKAAAREGAKSVGRGLAESGTASAGQSVIRREAAHGLAPAAADATAAVSRRVQRWWAVRSAGGMYQIMRRLPEALPRLSIAQITDMSAPLCARAGMRSSTWRPVRFLRAGGEFLLRIPPQKGLKYLAVQALSAGVGVVGFHKMEEHLASRRPSSP
jgi:hypothetical protein